MLDKGLMSTRVSALRRLGKGIDIMTYKRYILLYFDLVESVFEYAVVHINTV